MSANEFLPFGVGGGANVVSQAAWSAAALRSAGFSTGVAPSNFFNKAWRQSSVISAIVAQLIADNQGADVLDDGNVTGLYAQLVEALSSFNGDAAAAGLMISRYGNVVSNTVCGGGADLIVVKSPTSSIVYAKRNVSLGAQTTSVGANGLDSGTVQPDTFYYLYAIYNPATNVLQSILSANVSAPDLTSVPGFTHYQRHSTYLTDGSANLMRTQQRNEKVRFRVGTNPTSLPIAVSGVQGNVSTPTWVSVSLASLTPPVAWSASLLLSNQSNGGINMIAPTSGYGAFGSLTNAPIHYDGVNTGNTVTVPVEMMFDDSVTRSFYYASDSVDNCVYVYGWDERF